MAAIPKQFQEALKRGRYDPVFFSEFFCRTKPHPKQIQWLTAPYKQKQKILATANRWGKSLIQAVKLVWYSIYKIRDDEYDNIEDYIACNISITSDQAGIIFTHCEEFCKRAELNWCLKGDPIRKPFPMIKFGNGAQLWARSTERPQNLWGHVFDFVNFDEPAFEKRPEEVLPLIRTRLLDRNGELNFSGTPNGKNWYFDEFNKGLENHQSYNPECFSIAGATSDNPYISKAALHRLFNEDYMTEDQIRQHLYGEFIDFSSAVFSDKALSNFLEASLQLEGAQEDHIYLSGWDIGIKQDFTVGITLDVTSIPFKLVAFQRLSKCGWQVTYDSIRDRYNHFHDIATYFDATGLAQHIEEELADIKPHPVMIATKTGPIATGKSEILVNLVSALEQGLIVSPYIKPLFEELRFYRWEDSKLRTDSLFALALAFLAAKEQGFVTTGQIAGHNREFDPQLISSQSAGIASRLRLRERHTGLDALRQL